MSRRRITSRVRIQLLGLLMLMGMGALSLKLWWIQVAHGQEWTSQLRGSSQATVRIPSVRGEIKDRNGLTLVQNRASYEVDFYLPEMVKGYRERVGQPPTTEYRATINGMPKDLKEPDIIKIVNNGVVPRLNDLDLARDYNAGRLQKHYRNDTEVPFSYVKDIDFPTLAKFSEHDVGLPGVELTIKPVRSYVYGALATHLLGYVGMPNDIDKEDAKKFTFYQGDVEGKSNVEKIMDEYLRGKPGVRYLRRNAKGTIDGVLREDPPQAGSQRFPDDRCAHSSYCRRSAARRKPGGRSSCRSKQRQHFGDGFCAVVRSKYFHPKHQGEGLDSTAKGRGRSISQPRDQLFAAGVNIQAHHGARRIAGHEKSRRRQIQLRWRGELRRPLFPMLGSRKTLHAWYYRSRRCAQGLVRLLFLSVR